MTLDRYLYKVLLMQNKIINAFCLCICQFERFGNNITSTVLRALALANEVNLVS